MIQAQFIQDVLNLWYYVLSWEKMKYYLSWPHGFWFDEQTKKKKGYIVWPVSSLWASESPDTYFQSCPHWYQEIHSDLVLIISSGSMLLCSLKSFNFMTATGVPQGAVLDPLLPLHTKLLDEGSDLMASTALESTANKSISFFLHLATPQVLWRYFLFGQTLCQMPKYERKPWWESAFSQQRTQLLLF